VNGREVLDRFEAALLRERDLAPLVGMVAPYRAMMGRPEDMVGLLDRLTVLYAEARGVTLTLEDP
jgi:hypothetical protein